MIKRGKTFLSPLLITTERETLSRPNISNKQVHIVSHCFIFKYYVNQQQQKKKKKGGEEMDKKEKERTAGGGGGERRWAAWSLPNSEHHRKGGPLGIDPK